MKIKLYAIKTPSGHVAQCIKTGKPFIGPYTKEYKIKMTKLLKLIKESQPMVYAGCKLVKIKETWF